jgi:SNF2 family DNA or RNA helicase
MGGILADDMGLGKTVQALASLGPGRHLVVAPTSVAGNWMREAARFRPDLRTCLFHGPRRELDGTADLVVTTWAVLRLDLERLRGPWTTVMFDEAQAIKNPESQTAEAARSVQAELRLCVSGTPVENRLDELWSAMHVANPGLLGSRRSFRERFGSPIESGNRSARDALRRRIRPFVLRRTKTAVAPELPPRTDVVLRCTLSERERSLYDTVRSLTEADARRMLAGGKGWLQVLEVLLRMRQAACHPGLLPGGDRLLGSAKLELLRETLDEIVSDGHRVLIFSQWTSMLDLVEPLLREADWGFCRLDGATRDRDAEVQQFLDPSGPPIFLLSLKAGGTGLNLTTADYVIHLDPWWNPSVEDQATDRAHRIGQTRPVVSMRLIAEDTVEERILLLQDRKRDLVRAALDEAELAKALSGDELAALFA